MTYYVKNDKMQLYRNTIKSRKDVTIMTIGDVVEIEGKKMVLIEVDNREEYYSMLIDRTYYFVEEDYVKDSNFVRKSDLMRSAYAVEVKNKKELPEFNKTSNAYEITEVMKIARKTSKASETKPQSHIKRIK